MTEQDTGIDLTVILVNWNRAGLLRAALDSVFAQRGASFEVIVVDNGSTDGSVEMIREHYPRVTVIENKFNRGFCAANNQGIALASGNYVALLNNDAEADPCWLMELRRVFDCAEVGMAASKVLVFGDPRRIDKVGHLMYPDGQNRGRGTGALDVGQFDRQEEVLWPDGCAAMYRKRMLDEIGGFDEDFFAYGDDAELGLRARIAGWTCMYNPRARVLHHRGSTMGVASVRRLALIERNRVLLAAKLFPWSLLLLNPFYYAMRLMAGAAASAGDRGETALYPGLLGKVRMVAGLLWGDWQALWMLPRMLRKRREMARLRRLSPRETRRLLLANRISLAELSTQAAVQ